MSSNMTKYRREHPEYYEAEKKRDNERMKAKYANDPIRRERVKKIALERYYRLKAEKAEQNKIQNLYETQLENSVEEFLQNFN
jgi:hypothetical protein